MKMVRAVQLRNFQKHKKLTLELGPVTTIIGRTDAGKSAIIRALRWVFLNQPRGTDFIREGKKSCSVAVSIDGRFLKRFRGKENYYELDDEKFVAFKNNVPETIVEFLQIGDLNFQLQHDPIFWVGDTPAEVGKKLNAIVNMEMIDRIQNRMNKEERDNKAIIRYETERVADLKKHRKTLKRVPEAMEAFEAVVEQRKTAHGTSLQVARLRLMLETWTTNRITKRKAETGLSGAVAVESIGKRAMVSTAAVDRLSKLIEMHEKQVVPPPALFDDWGLVVSKTASTDTTTTLRSLIDRYTRAKSEQEKWTQELNDQKRLLEKISTTQNVCPKCGQIIMEK